MKKYFKFSILFLFGSFLLSNCNNSESLEDDFNNANDDQVVEKHIKRIEGIDAAGEQGTIHINYDSNNRVTSVSDGYYTNFLNYDNNGNLDVISINSLDKSINISDLYSMPYDLFDKGDVLEFDSNGNPIKLLIYDYDTTLIAEIFYDLDKPNPFFYTLKAAGVINVLDNVDLNFGSVNNPELMKARKLINYNIITGALIKTTNDITVQEIQIDYSFDQDNYPTYGNVYSFGNNGTSTFIKRYFYK